MHRHAILFAVVFALSPSLCLAQQAPWQDLVQSARQMAQQRRNQAESYRQMAGQLSDSGPANPFSATPQNANAVTNPAPGVQLSGDQIVIDLPGGQLTVPRANATPVAGSGHPNVGIPGAATTAVQSARNLANAVQALRDRDYRQAVELLSQPSEAGPTAPLLTLSSFLDGQSQLSAESAYEMCRHSMDMPWTDIRRLLGHPEDFSQQYQRLQQQALSSNQPTDWFLLAFWHTQLGHAQASHDAWKRCELLLPQDPVVQQMVRRVTAPNYWAPVPNSAPATARPSAQ